MGRSRFRRHRRVLCDAWAALSGSRVSESRLVGPYATGLHVWLGFSFLHGERRAGPRVIVLRCTLFTKCFSSVPFQVYWAGDDDVAPLTRDEDLEFRARLTSRLIYELLISLECLLEFSDDCVSPNGCDEGSEPWSSRFA